LQSKLRPQRQERALLTSIEELAPLTSQRARLSLLEQRALWLGGRGCDSSPCQRLLHALSALEPCPVAQRSAGVRTRSWSTRYLSVLRAPICPPWRDVCCTHLAQRWIAALSRQGVEGATTTSFTAASRSPCRWQAGAGRRAAVESAQM